MNKETFIKNLNKIIEDRGDTGCHDDREYNSTHTNGLSCPVCGFSMTDLFKDIDKIFDEEG